MRVVNVRNVTQAWRRLPETLRDAQEMPSRGGAVLVCPEPVATVYSMPTDRVLLDPARDANPFFHLVEALWMLAGRERADDLTPYVRDFAQYAEPDGVIHGAYGARWRKMHASVDQLDVIVHKLRTNPSDRQAVLQMWDMVYNCDLDGDWKDRPCNTHAYFRVRRVGSIRGGEVTYDDVLDMTVCCRSNDMIFGGYGANAVHFSVLQEYLAARIGVDVGTYTQLSNNFHVYKDVWARRQPSAFGHVSLPCAPMFTVPTTADRDVEALMLWHDEVIRHDGLYTSNLDVPAFGSPWFLETAVPMIIAHAYHRQGSLGTALGFAEQVSCPAWRRAATEWLERRRRKS